jgi:cytochrome c peroxidase
MMSRQNLRKLILLVSSGYTFAMVGCGMQPAPTSKTLTASNGSGSPAGASVKGGGNSGGAANTGGNAGGGNQQNGGGGGDDQGGGGGNGGGGNGGNGGGDNGGGGKSGGGNGGGGNAGGGNGGGGNGGNGGGGNGGNGGGGNGGGGNAGGGNGGGGGNAGGGNGGGDNGGGGNSGGGNSGGGNGGGGNGGGDDQGGGGGGKGKGGHGGGGGEGGNGGGERKLASLKTIPVPGPTATELNSVVFDKQAAIALGKAFFWDMQFGSDGQTACATCHYGAGADSRWMNQIDPGLRRVDGNGNSSPDSTTFSGLTPPNHALRATDFPLHKLSDPNNSGSAVLSDNNNIVGSQGVYDYKFNDVILGQGAENESSVADSVFSTMVNGQAMNVRRSTPRNAPSVINAVFNYRNFWDGRAQGTFNGVNPFGTGDPNARVLQVDAGAANGFSPVALRLSNSALASQAVGPPGSDVEMSATGRSFVKMGKKMLSVHPLALQAVAANDSVLASLSAAPGQGLNTTYVDMVKAAFQPKWWDSNAVVDANGNFLHTGTPQNTDEYSLMEYNFSMFWGVAIQMYEATQVSNNSRFDQFMEGQTSALTALEQRGLNRFTGKGGCSNCHNGAELTDATVSNVLAHGGVVEQLPGGTWHDIGFHNIGLRPTTDDLGLAAGDPSGLASLSVASLASQGLVSGTPILPGSAVSVRGAVKTPGLRNIELTGPYFLNGGQATLEQVVEFYSRGGDFPSADVDSNLERAGFSADDSAAVVAFLKALTDERVRAQSAPFDHPSLTVPNGMVMVNGVMTEQTLTIPATGASGGAALPKFCQNIGAACD